MSSYLQRLAGSVIQPREKVRPLAGSVFSANKSQPEPEGFFSADMPLSPAEAALPQSAQSTESQRAPETLFLQNEVVTTFMRKDMNAVANEPGAPKSLLPTSQQLPAQAHEQSGKKTIAPAETKEPRETVYTPLIVNGPAFSAQQSLANVPPSFSPAKHDQQKAAASRVAEREPDEIQIHIGRIEVSAVPQTPATPVTKAARKPSSLDDYLRRRDRRSV